MEFGDTFRAGFMFAKDLADPEFRGFIQEHGWKTGDRTVACFATTPIGEALTVLAFREAAWLAVLDESLGLWSMLYLTKQR